MGDTVRIVATSPIPEVGRRLFGELGDLILANTRDRKALASADVLIVRSARVDDAVLNEAPLLRAIARTGIGLDKIDIKAASRRGIPVLYAPDAGTRPVAEGTLALILAASKRLGELREVLVAGRWDERYDYETRDIAGATLGVVGFGRIGSAVAQLAIALGMRVLAYDPRLETNAIDEGADSVRVVGLEDLFGQADVISLHCDLNDTTRGLVDRVLLARVKPGAILINASRGGIVADDGLLIEALDRGWLSAVGLDVFAIEPPPSNHPLMRDPRVVCTPHTIGLTRIWNERVFTTLVSDVRRVLTGEHPVNVANPDALDAATGRTIT